MNDVEANRQDPTPTLDPTNSGTKTAPTAPILAPGSRVPGAGNGKTPGKQKHGCRNAIQWKKLGVDVEQVTGELKLEDRETTVAFLGRDDAEVHTAHRVWQRRLEVLGCRPEVILTFSRGAGEIRYYSQVPRRFIRLPSAGRTR